MNAFSEKSAKIVSIDVPSGIDPDTGVHADIWVQPDFLITFHKAKLGFSKINIDTVINPIGIPLEADLFVGSGDLRFNIPKRSEYGHKGQFGKVLIIGGSKQYSGAPALTGMAALQMGMDLVYVFAPKSVADVIRTYSPNLIVQPGLEDNICEKDIPILEDFIKKVDSVVIGPGLGTDPNLKKVVPMILTLLKEYDKPVVIDANAIKLSKPLKNDLPSDVIFTPHANEFYELTGKKMPDQTQFQKCMKLLES